MPVYHGENMNVQPTIILEYIAGRCNSSDEPLQVYWLQLNSDRDHYRSEIVQLRGALPIVPIVVREALFTNPNALMSDLHSVVSANREAFGWLDETPTDDCAPLVVLLLSRSPLALPQVSSPVTMPGWFPRVGGVSVHVTIQDITYVADAPLSARECRVDEVCSRLHELEGVLIRKLRAQAERDHRRTNALYDHIRTKDEADTSFLEFLDRATQHHDSVSDPATYRPSVRDGNSLVARLIRMVLASTPDELSNRSKAVARALGLDDTQYTSVDDSLLAVLFRPANKEPNQATRTARNLLVTVLASYQFVTGAAHADDYPRFPVLLLRSMSFNIRLTLERFVHSLSTRFSDE